MPQRLPIERFLDEVDLFPEFVREPRERENSGRRGSGFLGKVPDESEIFCNSSRVGFETSNPCAYVILISSIQSSRSVLKQILKPSSGEPLLRYCSPNRAHDAPDSSKT
jgi:hypothetical protein